MQVSPPGRFHVGHSLVPDKLSCLRSTLATDELNSVQSRARQNHHHPLLPVRACLQMHVKKTFLHPAVSHVLRLVRLPEGECRNIFPSLVSKNNFLVSFRTPQPFPVPFDACCDRGAPFFFPQKAPLFGSLRHTSPKT